MGVFKHIQDDFFEKIKDKLEPNLSLVHEISEALQISYDSSYRRLRGEKQISLEEAIILSKQFDISLDALCQIDKDYVTFKCYHVEPGKFCGSTWLDMILSNLNHYNNSNLQELVYAAKDPPIFNYFQFPEIAAFKFFFWEKTLFKASDLEEKKFDIHNLNPEIVDKCKKIAAISLKIPTTEIWNEDTFKILIRQVEHYWVSGYFSSPEDLKLLFEKIEQWLNHNQKEAEYGMRFLSGHPPKGIEGSYKLYENEIVLNDNSIVIKEKDRKIAFLTYNVLGLLASTNKIFCDEITELHQAIMSKSNLISQVGEKERNRFFNKLHEAINKFKTSYSI
ncbi:hypothetical protein [Saccharicrinis sp. 156]|uniref:hypothetical protein n=1 Tax=Saccharicrinis sp. 156 TaxID=3417574 RepID=UPI003D328578